MGKGDKKTAKGKRSQGSYGITRKRKKATNNVAPIKEKAAEKEKVKKVTSDEKPKKAAAPKKVAEKKPVEKKATEKKPAVKKVTKKDTKE